MSKKNINIVDIMKRCLSYRAYPVVFEDDCGLDCQLEQDVYAIKQWDPERNARWATLNISIARDRCDYYGSFDPYETYYFTGYIEIQGVLLVCQSDPTKTVRSKHPLAQNNYQISLWRPLTLKEKQFIKKYPLSRLSYGVRKPGSLVDYWRSQEELIEFEEIVKFAKEVFKARFQGQWEFYVKRVGEEVEKLDL